MCLNVCGVWCEGFAPHRLRGISGFHRKKAPACRIFPGKSRKKSGAFAPTLKMFKHFDWISSKSTCICQNLFKSVQMCLNVQFHGVCLCTTPTAVNFGISQKKSGSVPHFSCEIPKKIGCLCTHNRARNRRDWDNFDWICLNLLEFVKTCLNLFKSAKFKSV